MDEATQQRLTELAQRAYPGAIISAEDDSISVIGPMQRGNGRVWTEELIRINPLPRAHEALEAALLVLAGEPAWTTTRPTEPGDYWARISKYEPEIVHVRDAFDGTLSIQGTPLEYWGHGDETVHRERFEWQPVVRWRP